jgi:hypothetical protein
VNDLKAISVAADAYNLGAMQTATLQLSADSQTMLANLPPACMPNVRNYLRIALNDFLAASSSVQQGTLSGMNDASTQLTAGSHAIRRATAALNSYTASH